MERRKRDPGGMLGAPVLQRCSLGACGMGKKSKRESSFHFMCDCQHQCTGKCLPWLCRESIKQAIESVMIKFRKRVKHRKQLPWETT